MLYVSLDMPVKTHIGLPDGRLFAESHYCRGMPVTKRNVTRRSVCELWCMTTPGCLFYNYKRENDNSPILCEYADPIGGEMQALPDDQAFWDVYLMK